MFQCSDNENWCCATGNVDNFARNYNFTCCNNDDLKLNLGPAVFYGKATVSIPISTLERSSTSSASATTKTSAITQTTSDVQQTSASTIDAASFATQSTSATPSPTETNKSSTSSPTALAAGLGVGIPVALILVGLIAFLFYRLGQRQNRRALAQQQENHSDQTPDLPIPVQQDPSDGSPSDGSQSYGSQHNEALLSGHEIGYRGFEAEMAHQRSPVELEGKRML